MHQNPAALRRYRAWLVGLFLLVGSAEDPHQRCDACDKEIANASELENGEYVLAAYQAGRERIANGVFSAVRTTWVDGSDGTRSESSVRYFGAFDHPAKLQRFDFEAEAGKFSTAGKFIRTPDEFLRATKDGKVLTRLPADEQLKGFPLKPFDVRTLGGVDFLMQFAILYPFEKLITEMEGQLRDGRLGFEKRILAGTPQVHLRQSSATHDLCWDWILDPERDFAPISWETRRVGKDGIAEETPLAVMKSDYQQLGNSWVPVTVEYVSDVYLGKPKIRLSLAWQLVNASIDPKTFQAEGMQLPPSAWVVDERSGRRIIEGQFGDERRHHRGPPPVRDSTPRILLFVANGAALAIVIAILYFNRRRGSRE